MKQFNSKSSLGARLAACAAAALLLPSSLRAAGLQSLPGHVPPGVSALKSIGHLEATNRLRLSIGLPLRNGPDLDTLLQQLYDPASPNYHKYLKPAEFADKFGPLPADYKALTDFAAAHHLNITETHPNRTLLEVEAAVPDIESAFHVHLLKYNHPKENRTFYAPDTDPSVDLSVPILRVNGLDNYMKPFTKNVHGPVPNGGGVAKGTGSGPGGTFLGGDFRAAYVPGLGLTGQGQKVAIFELDGYFTQDILQYEAVANLPNVPITNVLVGGFPGNPESLGGDGEVSLDIEMVASMAPGIDQILVYEGFSQDGVLNRIATDDTANQISCSWGWFVPNPDAFEDGIYKQYAAQGQTFYDASGDDGTTLGNNIVPSSDDPYITQVGATTLTTSGPLGSWESDIVWSWFIAGTGFSASTGGSSSVYPIPTWQQGIDMTGNGGSPTFRNFPDVAMPGDNIWVVYDQGQGGSFGGTSCAAPLWTAYTALINEQGHNFGYQPVGFVCPAIYAICKGPQYHAMMHDVVSGNNTNFTYPTQFFAKPGYDLCVGWGSPIGTNLINALVPPIHEPVLLVATNTVSGGNGNGIIDFDECNDLNFIITNIGIATATGVQGFLYSTTLGAIVAQSTANYPNLPSGSAASSTTPFTISTEPSFICGTPINLALVMKCDQVTQTNFITLPTGVVGPPISFANSVSNNIPQGNFNGIFSSVVVSNLQSAAKFTVSVYATVEFDEGLSLQLISPNGTTIPLTAFPNGGIGANYGTACSQDSETTFDDDAVFSISAGSAPFVGIFQPLTPLSTLLPCSGTNLNGTWQLNAVEEFTGDPSALNCWSLNIEPYVCEDGGGQCPGSDLSLTMSVTPNPTLVFSNVVYNLTVSNAGPSSAGAVVISQTLPPGFSFVTSSNYPAQVTPGSTLQIAMGSVPVYGTATISIVASPTLPGLAVSTATVGSTGTDANPNNNSASASTVVSLPTSDLSVSMAAFPPTILQGNLETFTIVVTNNGPFVAAGVTLTNVLPANATYISSSVSQGSVFLPGTLFSLGALAPGSNAIVTVTVSPTGTGNVTDTASVGLGLFQTDPNLLNNTTSFTVTVGPSADLGVSASVKPATVVSGANYTYTGTVVNNGPSAATSVVFTQTLPGGTGLNASTFVSSSVAGVVVTNGVITWNIGTMASGSSLSFNNVLKAPVIQPGGRPIPLLSTLSVFGQPGDASTNNNVVTVSNLVETPTISIVPVSAVLVSQSGSVNNGAINPNQTVGVQLFLQNTGNLGTTNLVASLQSSGGVSLPSGGQNYGALMPGAAPVGQSFNFLASGTNGGMVVATLTLQDGSANLGTVAFDFLLPQVQTFSNTNVISIPATNLLQRAAGPAAPYPSTIQVSNVTGFVSKVTVTVSNLNHTFPNDIGLLLVSPAANTVLMDAAAALATLPASNVDLTFDSTAPTALTNEGNLISGTFRPADYNPTDIFTNAVFPPGATNALTGPYSTNLASFNGLAANGAWALYAHDDSDGDFGAISNGWTITITTVVPVNQTNSLQATMAVSTNKIVEGNLVTYLFSVTNNGSSAVSAYLTNTLPAGLAFVSASGNYTQPGPANVYLFNLGTLNPGAGVIITNIDMGSGSGSQTNFISAGLPVSTFTVGANSASSVVNVTVPVADLAAGISVNNNPAVAGQSLIYTLSVTNLGPSNSIATSGSFSLNGLTVGSVATTQGSFAVNNNTLACSFSGTLPVGEVASATLTATPLNAGVFTNVWTVNNFSDTNSATSVLAVAIPAPIIAPLSDALLTPSAAGAISPNVPVTVAFTVTNEGFAPTVNLVATLLSTNNVVPSGLVARAYGAIAPGGTATESFTFSITGTATATLALTDGANSLGVISFAPFLPPATTSFSAAGGIVIPSFGTANPYPAQIVVSGLTNSQGGNLLVSKVTVTLNNFAHSFPHDVNVLVANPAGLGLMLMGHAGGGFNATNVNLTFDDAATQILSASQLVSGTYLPTDYAPIDTLPNVAPASTSSNLAIFDGTNPNGPWSLYVYDDTPGNGGMIAGGWSLAVSAVDSVNPAALLAASMVSAPNPVFGGNFLSCQITVTNLGPDAAGDVVLTDTLPGSVVFSGGSASQGAVSASGNTVTCNLGAMSANATAVVTIRVITGAAGTIVNTATATAAGTTDLYPPQATAANSVTVLNAGIFLQATNSPSGVQLTVLGQPSQNYVIQASPDLLNWTSIFTNTPPLGSSSFSYTDSQSNVLRFYRVIHGPQ
ncbi:MAG TPA: protease pro-enzyme activation domain-containing protein [Verrucomicrobiae bacterium]|jgi:uncharacterized repeat protein (TIGR01451 family)